MPPPVDLTLPTPAELLATATPTNPQLESDRFHEGNPAEITDLGASLAKAGGDSDEALRLSLQSQGLLGPGFTNNGTPVYGQDLHLASLPKNFPDAGEHLTRLGKRLGEVALDLRDRTTAAKKTVDDLKAYLDKTEADYTTTIAFLRNAQGLIPVTEIPNAIALRDNTAAAMRQRVNADGATLAASSFAYESTLADVMKLLADIGYIPPAELDAGPGGDAKGIEQRAKRRRQGHHRRHCTPTRCAGHGLDRRQLRLPQADRRTPRQG